MTNKPTISHIVLYRTDGRNGLVYDLPAMITCTKDSHPGNYPDGSRNPLPVPESDMHVHLTVFTPGGFGSEVRKKGAPYTSINSPEADEDWKDATAFLPGSGSYVEWNVPFHDDEARDADPRTWRWPVIK